MSSLLSHSFNIRLSDEVSDFVREIQTTMKRSFTDNRTYEAVPHLSVLNRFMEVEDTDRFMEALAKEFSNDLTSFLMFDGFGISDNGKFIILNLSPESTREVIAMHERALSRTIHIGLEVDPDSGYSQAHRYFPHISLIKVNPELAQEALAAANAVHVNLKEMPVTHFDWTRQTPRVVGLSEFVLISEIALARTRL